MSLRELYGELKEDKVLFVLAIITAAAYTVAFVFGVVGLILQIYETV